VEAAIRQLSVLKEGQIDPGQFDEARRPIRLTAHDDESPSVVVGAIAVLGARGREASVFPKAPMVGHPSQVIESRPRERTSEAPAGRQVRPHSFLRQCAAAESDVN
jgi:hypothetical protein